MDYLEQVRLRRHTSWAAFETGGGRRAALILFTTAADLPISITATPG
jgi:tRNA(Leu) C34 or U34 (ribose-2'-O)-methylase TrmL